MIKQLVIISGLLVALLLGLPEGGRVYLIHNTDGTVKRGEETLINVTVSKIGISGFAKYQVTLPEGLVAAPKNLKGAMFSQDGPVVKITWASLPEGDQFVFSYRLIAAEDADTGLVKISGRFAYLENNEKRNVGGDPFSVRVLPGEQRETAETPSASQDSVNLEKMLEDEGFACMQSAKRISENEFHVSVKMLKNSVNGFVKIETQFCEGLALSPIETAGGVFSANEGKVKIVWTDFPAANEVVVRYKVQRTSESAWMSACSLEGEIAYLIEDQSRKCVQNAITMHFVSDEVYNRMESDKLAQATSRKSEPSAQSSTDQLATNSGNQSQDVNASQQSTSNETTTDSVEPVNKANSSSEPTKPEPVVVQNTQDKPEKKRESNVEQEQTSTEASSSSFAKTESKPVNNPRSGAVLSSGKVQYKVQVCATRRNVTSETVRSAYKMDETPVQEMHEGWYKFTVGGYPEYKEAREKRESLAPYNLPGPFVTAYNSGNRITVQEALMITKQEWVK